jgi:hypothetical protein
MPDRGQLDLDDLLSGAEQAGDGADSWWRETADRAVRQLASEGREFDVDDVRGLGVGEPDHPARWGSVFVAAAHAGLIEAVGARRSTRQARRGSLLRVWRGRRSA